MSITQLNQVATPLVIFGPELEKALALDLVNDDYRNEFLQNISELILESTLVRYFGSLDEESQSVFETWIEMYHQKNDFLNHLRRTYPDFIAILEEEIITFKSEALRIGIDEKPKNLAS